MSDSAFVKRDFHRILCDDAEVFSWILSKASIGVFYINLEHQERFHITTSFWDTIGYRKPEKEVELDVFWEVLGVAGKKTTWRNRFP